MTKHERDSLRLSKERSRSSVFRGGEGGSSVRTGSNLDELLPSLPSEDARDYTRTAFPTQLRGVVPVRGQQNIIKANKRGGGPEGKSAEEERTLSPGFTVSARKSSIAQEDGRNRQGESR